MPQEIKFELPAQQQLDTSIETTARVEAGPDIHCPYCGARNPGDAKICKQCGGDLTQGARRAQGEVLGALQTAPAPEVTCPHCGAKNPATATKCAQCGGTLTKEAPEPTPTPKAAPFKVPSWLIVVAVLGLLACCVVGYLFTRGSAESVAIVRGVEWTYSVQIDELVPVTYEAWRDEVPANARLGECTRRVRRTVSEPVPNATEVCGTPYVVDTGTGKGRVEQDCKYLVTDNWCRYTVIEWRPTGQKSATGQNYNPEWPVLSLTSGQRQGARSEMYKVLLDADGKQFIYSPSSLQEFRRFQPGSKWIVKTNAFGGLVSVEPAR